MSVSSIPIVTRALQPPASTAPGPKPGSAGSCHSEPADLTSANEVDADPSTLPGSAAQDVFVFP